MSKVRAKCAICHKTFKASPKQTMCEDCERKVRAANKAASARPAVSAAPMAPPKISGPGAAILDPRLAATASVPAAGAEVTSRDGAASRAHDSGHQRSSHERTVERTPSGENGHAGRHDKAPAGAKAPHEPRPKREPKPPTPPFDLTDELRERIEVRYLELAQPEYDGIRTQLAQELSVPKSVVKRVVQDLRARKQLPSWWDLQAYTGTPDDLERIRAAYVPMLPLPAIGVHKHLASDLGLDERLVYQGIRRIRAEMRLPQFNPPEAHEGERHPTATDVTAANASDPTQVAP